MNQQKRIDVLHQINSKFSEIIETDFRVIFRGVVRTTSIRTDAKIIGRLALACCYYSVRLLERAPVLREFAERADAETHLELVCLGKPCAFECVFQFPSLRSDKDKIVVTMAEDLEEALNAWLEADYYLQIKHQAYQYMSPSALRVLHAFDPAQQRSTRWRGLIVYSGAFETNRRRH